MTQGKISKKQKEILEYIKSQILERGFPPAVREICEAVNLKSTSSVTLILKHWKRTGISVVIPQSPERSRYSMILLISLDARWLMCRL